MKKLMMLLPLLGLAACSAPQPTQYETVGYQCGKKTLDVAYDHQAMTAQFVLGGVWQKLLLVESSDEQGDRYAFGSTSLWKKGDTIKVARQSGTVLTCAR